MLDDFAQAGARRLRAVLVTVATAVAAVVTGITATPAAVAADCGPCMSWNGHWALGPAQYACWRPGHKVKWIFHLYPNPSHPLNTFALSFTLHNLTIISTSGDGTLTTSHGKPTIVLKNVSSGQTVNVVMFVGGTAAQRAYFVAAAAAKAADLTRKEKLVMPLPRHRCS